MDAFPSFSTFFEFHKETFLQIRRRLHQLAELSTFEFETGKYLTQLLKQWGISYEFPVAETGITATIEGKKILTSSSQPKKVVALRADMDALPLSENSNCTFSSLTPGVMHGCGHDAHMTIVLAVAYYFQEIRPYFSGTVRIFFQPAEETIGGARRMIQEGCMKHPPVDYILGLHVAPYLETGTIQIKYGNFYASSDEIKIRLWGKSSHGAYPEAGIDAILMAATVIQSLQTIVSRKISPLDSCVLTLGTIHGGTAHNILAGQVEITGALRTIHPTTREQVKSWISQQVQNIATAFGGRGEVIFSPGYDALINTDFLVDVLKEVAIPLLGKSNILWKDAPGMGVEDFSFFLKEAPGVFFHLGCGNEKKGLTAPLHSCDFQLDEDCLLPGMKVMTALTLKLIGTNLPDLKK